MPNLCLPTIAAGMAANDLIVFLLGLAILVGAARLFGELARRFGFPMVIGEIVAGIVVGQTVLGHLAPDLWQYLFPDHGDARIGLDVITTLGVTLLLLVAGMEVNLSTVWKQGIAAISVALCGMVVPLVIGVGLAWFLYGSLNLGAEDAKLPVSLFVGLVLALTALPVISKVLLDLNIFRSDMGMLIMSAAMVTDILGWLGFAVILALMNSSPEAGAAVIDATNQAVGAANSAMADAGGKVLTTVWQLVAFMALMLTVGRWLVNRVLVYIQGRWSWPGGVIGFMMVFTLLCAALTEWIGVHAIFGAFIAGVVIGDSKHLRERTRDNMHQFINNIFAPVFFAGIALRVDFISAFDYKIVLILLIVGAITKVGGATLGARLAKLNRREALAIGFAMATHGAMEIILGQLALADGLITEELFVGVIVMSLATSLASGPMMQRLLNLKQQRRLGDVLSDKHFLISLEARRPQEAIGELAKRAATLCNVPEADIAEAVWQREQLMHTGIGNSIAVPHARLEGIEKPLILLGRSDQGVDFDAPDGRPARLIFLLLTPPNDQSAQLELLGMVSKAFMKDQTRAEALAAANFTELLAALSTSQEAHDEAV